MQNQIKTLTNSLKDLEIQKNLVRKELGEIEAQPFYGKFWKECDVK